MDTHKVLTIALSLDIFPLISTIILFYLDGLFLNLLYIGPAHFFYYVYSYVFFSLCC